MPTPSAGTISMSDVRNETNATETMHNFFSLSQIGGAGGLMYHNLAMATGNTTTARVAIYDPFTTGASGTNLKLSNWYNYSQTPTAKLDMTFTNNNTNFDIICTVYLTDPAGAFSQQAYMSSVLLASGGTDVQTNYDTGVQMDTTNFTAGVYYIEIACTATVTIPAPSPPYPGIVTTIGTPTDTDGVGPGTVRNARPGAIPVFDDLTPLAQLWIVRGNIGGTNGIYINKRTTFDVTFS
jgi:hypothetical protein